MPSASERKMPRRKKMVKPPRTYLCVMFVCLFICLFIHLFIYLIIHLFIYLFIYSIIHSFIHLFIYLLIHSFPPSPLPPSLFPFPTSNSATRSFWTAWPRRDRRGSRRRGKKATIGYRNHIGHPSIALREGRSHRRDSSLI